MKVLLIILAVLAVITAAILSLTAEFTVIFDNGWTTRIKVLFFEKDIELTKLLSFMLFPEKAAADISEERREAHEQKEAVKEAPPEKPPVQEVVEQPQPAPTEDTASIEPLPQETAPAKEEKSAKPNYFEKLWAQDGIVGILLLISNLLQTAGSAVTTLFKGLHIYSLYVKMIIGGGDAADVGETFGTICGIYYPIKGFILNGMKVDQYDDFIQPDFIAPSSEYEFQFIGGISVGLLMRVGLKAGRVFLINLIKNR